MATRNQQRLNHQLLIAAVVAILVLLVLNVFLLVNKYRQDQTIHMQKVDLDEATRLKAELERQYFESLAELEELRGTNEELNALIEQQKHELFRHKRKIEELLGAKRDLIGARKEMDHMRAQLKKYKAEIEKLQRQNEQLVQKNKQLEQTANQLRETVAQQQATVSEVQSIKKKLEEEKRRFEAEKQRLMRQVTRASVIMLKRLSVSPLKMRKSGRTVMRKRAKDVDLLKVCFTTASLDPSLVRPGPERFYVRIVSPIGETLGSDDEGSGVIRRADTNEEVRFTQAVDYQYENDEAELCLLYEPPALTPGIYTVEVYNKGYLAGETEFSLK